MKRIETLADFQKPPIDDVLCEVTFTAEGGGAALIESAPLKILYSGIKLHFLGYGLFKKDTEYGKDHFIIHTPGQNGERSCEMVYDRASQSFVQQLEEVVVVSPLDPPDGAITPMNYEYRHKTLKSGYVYIFYDKNEAFHKELLVDEVGQFINISWDDAINKEDGEYTDIRIPTSRDYERIDDGFLVPKIEDDPTPIFWIAFSPVQWSVVYHTKLRTNCELREKRMRDIKCTGIKKGEKNDQARHVDNVFVAFPKHDQAGALVFKDKLERIAVDEWQQMDDFYEDMFVTLHDPLNCADEICMGIDQEVIKLKAIMVSLQTGKSVGEIAPILQEGETISADTTEKGKQIAYLHRLAQLSYDFVYNNHENEEKYSSDRIQSLAGNIALDLTIGSYLRPFIEQNGIDRAKVEKLLAVQERKLQRNIINSYRDDLGNFMKSKYYQDIMDDYLNNIPDHIEDGIGIVAMHKIALGNYPNIHDRHLDLKSVYALQEDIWFKYINETLYNENPKEFNKSTKLLDYKFDIQDVKFLDLTKKSASTLDKILKAYANHDEYLGNFQTLKQKTLPILGKISYFRDKKTRVAIFKFKKLEEFEANIHKQNLRLEIDGQPVTLRQYKKHWHVEYKRMTQNSVEQLIASGDLEFQLKTNPPKRFKAEVEKFLKSNAFGAIVLVIEAIVWAKTIKNLSKNSSRANIEKFGFASIKLGAAVFSLAEKMKVYDKYLAGKGLEDGAMYFKIKKFRSRVGTLKIMSSAITVFTASRDSYTSFAVRDNDAAALYGMAAGVGAVFLAADVSALIGGGAAVFAIGFWPAAILGGVLIGCYYLVSKYFKDTQLEAFFKNFPLSDHALSPESGELPYQYINRLVSNRKELIFDPWIETTASSEYKTYANFEKAFTAFLDITIPTMTIVEPAPLEYINYNRGFDKRNNVTNRFKAYIYSGQKITDIDDIDMKAYYYPLGIRTPLRESSRFEITLFTCTFPKPKYSSIKSEEVMPNCIVDFSLPQEFSESYRRFHDGEILFLCRLRVQNDEFSPTNFEKEARYVFGNSQTHNRIDNNIKHLTSIFSAHRYGQSIGKRDVKLKNTSFEQTKHKIKVIKESNLNNLESYSIK